MFEEAFILVVYRVSKCNRVIRKDNVFAGMLYFVRRVEFGNKLL